MANSNNVSEWDTNPDSNTAFGGKSCAEGATSVADFNDLIRIITAQLADFFQNNPELAGQLKLANGGAGAPSLTFSSDPDTGVYRAGANQVGIAAGGSISATFTNSAATFTASPRWASDPSNANDLVRKSYLESTYLPLAGGTMTGDLKLLGSNPELNLSDDQGGQQQDLKAAVNPDLGAGRKFGYGGLVLYPAAVTARGVTISPSDSGQPFWSVGGTDYKIWNENHQGAGTGMDADLLDGQHGSYYRNAENLNAGTVPNSRLSGTYTGFSINAPSKTATFGNGNSFGATTFTGTPQWNSDPSSANDLVRKSYLESTYLPLAGGTMTGKLNVASNDGLQVSSGTPQIILNDDEGLSQGALNITINPDIGGEVLYGRAGFVLAPGGGPAHRGILLSHQQSDYPIWQVSSNSYKIWNENHQGAGTGMDADLLDGQHGSYYRNASNLNAGTIPNARLSGTYTAISINSSGTATFGNGNSFGSTTFTGAPQWGTNPTANNHLARKGYVDTTAASVAESAAQSVVNARIAMSGLGVGNLGSTATLRCDAGTETKAGETRGAAVLVYANANGGTATPAQSPPGGSVWMCLGYAGTSNGEARTTSWRRVS